VAAVDPQLPLGGHLRSAVHDAVPGLLGLGVHPQLDELITTTYTLDQVAQGYEDMHARKNIRGVILYD